MPQSQNIDNTKDSPSTKKNYSAIRYGNEKGSISFGHIHKDAAVTSGVMLQTPDAEHSITLDVDGEREGWTSVVQPGNFQVECGSANEEPEDSLILNAKNGNICITATNGKIRFIMS